MLCQGLAHTGFCCGYRKKGAGVLKSQAKLMSACLSNILLKVLNGSFKKVKPIHYVVVAPMTLCFIIDDCTGKSLSEPLILTSSNPQYDKILFIDLPVQYMKTTSSEYRNSANSFRILF